MAAERTGDRLRRGSLEAGADKGLSTAVFANGRWRVLSMGFMSLLKQASLHCLHFTQQNSSHRFLFSPCSGALPLSSPFSTLSFFSLRLPSYFLHSLLSFYFVSSFLPFRTRVNWNKGKVLGFQGALGLSTIRTQGINVGVKEKGVGARGILVQASGFRN